MPVPRSTRAKRRAPKTKAVREIEGAALATLDGFMDLIGTRQDVPLLKPTPQNKMKAEGQPLVVKALDFVAMVFANKKDTEKGTKNVTENVTDQ